MGPGARGTEKSAVGDVSQVLRPKKSQDDDDEEKVVVTDYSEEKLEATEVLASEGPGRGGRHGTKCSYNPYLLRPRIPTVRLHTWGVTWRATRVTRKVMRKKGTGMWTRASGSS